MPRTPPTTAPPSLKLEAPESWTVQLQTITPMFGGSAQTRQIDPRHPVRAASVRGHLRFWWRATAGASCKNAEDLHEKEAKIWGDTKSHGKVKVEVIEQSATEPRVPQLPRELGYATFPFQEQRPSQSQPKGVAAARAVSVSFTLCLTCPADLYSQIVATLHAWVLFGGIGARTRRGCGSMELKVSTSNALGALTDSPPMLTTLPESYFLGKPQRDPVQAWAEAVRVYSNFRQGDGVARTSSKGRPPVNGKKAPPGRSFWPEPDSLRRATGRHATKHPPRHPNSEGFPRADLGLPIGFQFKDEKAGDPPKLTLQGAHEGQERFASPVITKAACIEGEYYPLIMLLDSPHVWQSPGGVTLVMTARKQAVTRRISDDKLQFVQQHKPQNGLSVREAFKKFVRENGFQEARL